MNMGFVQTEWLFFFLLGLSFLLTIILVLIWICWCLKRKKPNLASEKLELKSTVPFHYEAGLHTQQEPIKGHLSAKSVPTSPMQTRYFLDTSNAISRRHSLDPQTLDLDMYSREKSESMGSLPYLGLGQLCFELFYERETEKLQVKIASICQLQSKSVTTTPHVFIKVVLMPDKKRRYQTKTIKDTEPEFNEEFVFAVPVNEVLTRTLRMTVCSFDRFSRQNTIGYVVFPLTEAKENLVMEGGTGEIWREITKENLILGEVNGSMLISLLNLPTAGRLTIVILKCKDLRVDDDVDAGVYVKVSMVSGGKTIKTKKTSTFRKRDISNPVFNESFVFDIPNEYLEKISFIMAVCASPRSGSSKRIVGRIVVGPYMYSSGDGLAHWNDMLLSPRHSVAHWHDLTR